MSILSREPSQHALPDMIPILWWVLSGLWPSLVWIMFTVLPPHCANQCPARSRTLICAVGHLLHAYPGHYERHWLRLSSAVPSAFPCYPVAPSLQEIDLRIGASFTRFQTMLLQNAFALPSADGERKQVISYGPCQVPTPLYTQLVHLGLAQITSTGLKDQNRVCRPRLRLGFKHEDGCRLRSLPRHMSLVQQKLFTWLHTPLVSLVCPGSSRPWALCWSSTGRS